MYGEIYSEIKIVSHNYFKLTVPKIKSEISHLNATNVNENSGVDAARTNTIFNRNVCVTDK